MTNRSPGVPFALAPVAGLRASYRAIEATCRSCGAVQPVDLLAVACAHGELATLGQCGHTIPCVFCGSPDMRLREVTGLH